MIQYRVSQTKVTTLFEEITNSISMKEVCLDRVTLHHVFDTKLDPIDDFFNKLITRIQKYFHKTTINLDTHNTEHILM